MELEIHINKTVDENAALLYEKAKKSKKKLAGIRKAISDSEAKIVELKENYNIHKEREIKKKDNDILKKSRKSEWFEKFRWMYTSKGKLVVGGRDATSNESVVKKHTEKGDLVFHTDMAGSPFMILKSEGKEIDPIEIEETAQFLACYSRGWKRGLSSVEVFYVNPDQVTKEAKAGESLGKGSFMIYGKTNYVHAVMKFGITVLEDRVYVGAINSIRALLSEKVPGIKKSELDKKFVTIFPGSTKTSQIAKEIRSHLDGGDVDELVKMLPPGGCRIGK